MGLRLRRREGLRREPVIPERAQRAHHPSGEGAMPRHIMRLVEDDDARAARSLHDGLDRIARHGVIEIGTSERRMRGAFHHPDGGGFVAQKGRELAQHLARRLIPGFRLRLQL
ncbi:hypothetical protein D3C78_1586440 [compost metagenome]